MAMPLILVDDDAEYARRFADWIRLHPEAGFLPVTESEAGLAQPAGFRPAWGEPIRLVSGTVWNRMQNPCHTRRVLLEDGTAVTADAAPRIPKYQPMPDLAGMLRLAAEKQGWLPAGGALTVSAALQVVIHLAGSAHLQPVAPVLAAWSAKEHDTLLLDLDPLQTTRLWFPAISGEGLSRLAYEAGGGSRLDAPGLARCLGRDGATGVRCLRPPALPEDAAGFGVDAVRRIVTAAADTGIASIVLDAGAGLHARNMALAGIAGRLYLVSTADPFGYRLLEEALDQLSLSGVRSDWAGCDARTVLQRLAVHSGMGAAGKPASDGAAAAGRPEPAWLPSPFPHGWPMDPWAIEAPFVDLLIRTAHDACGRQGEAAP